MLDWTFYVRPEDPVKGLRSTEGSYLTRRPSGHVHHHQEDGTVSTAVVSLQGFELAPAVGMMIGKAAPDLASYRPGNGGPFRVTEAWQHKIIRS